MVGSDTGIIVFWPGHVFCHARHASGEPVVGVSIGGYRQPDLGVSKCVAPLRRDDARPEATKRLARRLRAGGVLGREAAQD